MAQFKKAMGEARLGLGDEDQAEIFARFEYKKSGKMKYKDLLETLKV